MKIQKRVDGKTNDVVSLAYYWKMCQFVYGALTDHDQALAPVTVIGVMLLVGSHNGVQVENSLS